MAMATQTTLFTPPFSSAKPNEHVSVPWKQSPTLSFTNPNLFKLTISSNIKTAAVTEEATEAPVGFTPPELDPNTPSPIFSGNTGLEAFYARPKLKNFM